LRERRVQHADKRASKRQSRRQEWRALTLHCPWAQ
jgi:hypothetical protein